MKPKVVWTSREWGLVAEWFVQNSIDPDSWGFIQNLSTAQKAKLPGDRQRVMVGLPKEVRQKLKAEIAALKQIPKPGPVVQLPKSTPQELSTEDLLVELARRVAKFVRTVEQLSDAKTLASTADRGFHPKHNPEPQSYPRVEKPKILVIGPIPKQ